MEAITFTENIRRCEKRLYQMAYSILYNQADTADALQEAIVHAWEKRYTLRSPERFDSWLMRILINECRNIQRKRMRGPLLLESIEEGTQAYIQDSTLHDAIRSLPEKLRIPLLLQKHLGFSVKEISKMLGIPQSTVKWRLHEAKEKLLGLLSEEVEP